MQQRCSGTLQPRNQDDPAKFDVMDFRMCPEQFLDPQAIDKRTGESEFLYQPARGGKTGFVVD